MSFKLFKKKYLQNIIFDIVYGISYVSYQLMRVDMPSNTKTDI